ncbi:MAG: acyl-CoA synthetase [Candidatus Geothermarchaeales archaeon]
MALNYSTYEDAEKNFKWSEKWGVFEGNRENFNITHECIDRHVGKGMALRIKFDDGSSEAYTFKEISRYTSQFANAIDGVGVGSGDRVAVMIEPSLEFYVGMLGALKRGAVVIPCSPLFGPEAIEYRIKDSKAKMLIIPEERAKSIDTSTISHLITKEELREFIKDEGQRYQSNTSAEDLAMLQYSSGTTGMPKGVPYRHKSVVTLAPVAKFGYGIMEGDKYFCPSPPTWGHGIWGGTFAPLTFGVAVGAYSGKFDPEIFLEGLEEFEVNNVSAAPTVFRKILASGKVKDYDLKIEKLTYTGEPMDLDTFYQLKKQLGVTPHGFYGSTEVGVIILNYAGFNDWRVKPESLGKPMLGLEVAVIDQEGNKLPPGRVGEIAVRRGGTWIRVGDAGVMDEDGYFWHRGRSDDIIISAGYTIGPDEVEAVLNEYEAVQESGVIGVPHRERGQIVKAFIKLKPDFEPSEELKQRLQEYVKNRLSKHEYPREIEFTDEIPKTKTGKIQRKKLRERERRKRGGSS